MQSNSPHNSLRPGRIDWICVGIYMVLMFVGWMTIYASSYNEVQNGIFDLGLRSGMQFVWMCICMVVGLVVILLDDNYYHIVAYPLYWISILVLLGTLFFGKEVNGAKAWLMIGPVAIQPAEFVKFTTALAVSRFMSGHSFSIHRFGDIMKLFGLILIPVTIIIMQNDTGSALVYAAFLIAAYREGLNGWFFGAIGMAILVFVLSFLVTDFALLAAVLIICVVAHGLQNGHWRKKIVYLAIIVLVAMTLYFGTLFIFKEALSAYYSLLISSLLSLLLAVLYAYRSKLKSVYNYIALFAGSLVFGEMVDYIFNNLLKAHHRGRILDIMGIVSDPKGFGYNVNQSKIAVGSGGFSGKGYLSGTQTRYDFVPEQGTDFIFSSVAEEWGFLGSTLVVVLFGVLIMRLIDMGERQKEAFGRIYCYSVASIFFLHVVINIGMVIGIMPVIGIPLPFFSYGGSSLLLFTLLLFVALKMDSAKRETTMY